MKTFRRWRWAALMLLVVGSGTSWATVAQQRSAGSVVESDTGLDLLLTREAQRILDADRLKRSKPPNVTVKARADIAGDRVIIDFGSGFLPAQDDSSTEEIEQYISNSLRVYAEKAGLHEVQVDVLYEGLPFEHYFPEPYSREGGGAADKNEAGSRHYASQLPGLSCHGAT